MSETYDQAAAAVADIPDGAHVLIGGFGSEIARLCVAHGAKEPIAVLGLPNRFIAHGTVDQLLAECGLTSEQIAQRIKQALGCTEKKHG